MAGKIEILDGAFGTMAQGLGLPESDYVAYGRKAAGCNDVLCITRPDAVEDIHRQYIEAGATIIETNSFNANAISLSDYGLEEHAYEISKASAEIGRRAARGSGALVAGSMGPTNRSLSISPDVEHPEYRDITFDEMRAAYRDQARGLLDGGVDMLLIETAFDTLNAKAAIAAIRDVDAKVPIMISATLSDASGRTLSGQTIEAFAASVAHANPWSIGLNCGYGAKHLLPYVRRLAQVWPGRISVHPNAGLPNISGGYDETPEMFAADMEAYFQEGLVNVAGGCCGTTPAHITAMAETASLHDARPLNAPQADEATTLAGLEPLRISPQANFINVGERTNVAGSAKFAKMIRQGDYAQAITVAREQVDAGAQIIDICMDDAMIDGPQAMRTFANLIASEPEIARVPLMIDSSHWDTIEAGLKCAQGKCIVNSISLKEGEEKFLEHARAVMSYGAAAVVMLFDEKGQADTYERKIEVAERAYRLLRGIGFPANDIIIDPNILAISTGMPEHDRYGRDFIEATRWIKANLPGAKVSGGVSNLSFSFRGNNTVRKAMHSAFLYHAIAAGMDMAIVNPQMVVLYDDIEPGLLERVEDAVLYRREDAAERLAEIAQEISEQAEKAKSEPAQAVIAEQELPVAERLSRALLTGDTATVAADAALALSEQGSAMAVISNILMPAMERVGVLFGQGKMFLPQVVKSARVMKQAVDALTAADPTMDPAAQPAGKGTIVVATVKGDVHDIGKNIVSVVLACNGFTVRDLGVMVEPERIVQDAIISHADAIGLSGLITPSLQEMIRVAEEASRNGLDTPIIIGGATTTPLHTAVKIATATQAPVIHARDAADTARILACLTGEDRESFIRANSEAQRRLREAYEAAQAAPAAAPSKPAAKHAHGYPCCAITHAAPDLGAFTLEEVAKSINWAYFFAAWEVPGRLPDVFDHPKYGSEARKLYADAQAMLERIIKGGLLELRGVARTFPARQDGDDIVLDIDGQERRMHMPRKADGYCVADYVQGEVTLFALSAGFGLDNMRKDADPYDSAMAKLLADRLTEAYAASAFPTGCRLAFGYPAIPDHDLKRDVFEILDVETLTGMQLTETCMIMPGEAICGIWLENAHFDQ